jgi:hypothetical protein
VTQFYKFYVARRCCGCHLKQIIAIKNITQRAQENSGIYKMWLVNLLHWIPRLSLHFSTSTYSFWYCCEYKSQISHLLHILVCTSWILGQVPQLGQLWDQNMSHHMDVQKLASNNLHMKYKWSLWGVGVSMYTRKQKYEYVVANFCRLIIMGPRGPFCAGLRCLTQVVEVIYCHFKW